MRVAVGNLKGGVGKTTTATFLALGLARTGRVLLVDADEQQPSAVMWAEAAGEAWPDAVVVKRWARESIARRVDASAADFAHVVIDTGPRDDKILRAALSVVDCLVVPLAPRPLDLREVSPTVELAGAVGVPVSVLLVAVRRGTRSAVEVRSVLRDDLRLPVLAAEVRLSESVSMSYGTAPTDLGDYEAALSELAGVHA